MNRTNVAIFNDTNTETSRHYGCSLVMFNLVQKLKEHQLNPVFFWPVGNDWRKHKNLIKKKANYAAVIVNGEGSIHHSVSKEKPIYISEIAKFAQEELKKPVYLINSTIYENTDRVYENLKYFKKIYVRESSTFETLRNYKISSEIVPDLTFTFPIVNGDEKVQRNGYLITDSTYNDLRKLLKSKSSELDWEYISMKESQPQSVNKRFFLKLRKFLKKKNYKLLKKAAHKPIQFEDFLKERIKSLGVPFKNSYEKIVDHEWFIDKIKRSEFVVTGRFHTLTLCIKTKTPFLALPSNTPKISAILNDIFQSTERLITVNELEKFGNQIPEKFKYFSEKESKQIDNYNKKAVRSIENMFIDISANINRI